MKKEGRVLIVDDDKHVLRTLELLLECHFKNVMAVSNPNRIPELVQSESFDVVLLDMNFSAGINTGNEGVYWLKKIKDYDPDVVVVLITAFGDIDLAVKTIKKGATDFVLKPWENDKLVATMRSALKLSQSGKKIQNLEEKQRQLIEDIDREFEFVSGSSQIMKNVFATINKVAETDANVLITGENGTGKELVAREIHRLSARKDEVFIRVDLASLNENIFESELFGYVKGAFTDAKENRKGRFEIASGGTLFLDEIGNLNLVAQAKILTVLEQRNISPLGSNRIIPIDIRLVSATNRDLDSLITDNLFREDLLYRLNTIKIEMPALRNLSEDIIILSGFFLNKFRIKYDKPKLKMNSKALEKLEKYPWPGNVRELQHTIEKAVILTEDNILGPDDFIFRSKKSPMIPDINPRSLEDIEKQAIIEAIKNNKGVLSDAAKELGIARQTMYNKMARYGL